MTALLRRFVVKAFHALRDVWLVFGVCVALLFLAESCYWFQDSARHSLRSATSGGGAKAARAIANPATSQPWFPEFAREFGECSTLAWRPYVYFRRADAYRGRYVNVDSQRHRVTPQPATPVARVFFFGGSTMWGSFLRDDHTIAAEAARRLQSFP